MNKSKALKLINTLLNDWTNEELENNRYPLKLDANEGFEILDESVSEIFNLYHSNVINIIGVKMMLKATVKEAMKQCGLIWAKEVEAAYVYDVYDPCPSDLIRYIERTREDMPSKGSVAYRNYARVNKIYKQSEAASKKFDKIHGLLTTPELKDMREFEFNKYNVSDGAIESYNVFNHWEQTEMILDMKKNNLSRWVRDNFDS